MSRVAPSVAPSRGPEVQASALRKPPCTGVPPSLPPQPGCFPPPPPSSHTKPSAARRELGDGVLCRQDSGGQRCFQQLLRAPDAPGTVPGQRGWMVTLPPPTTPVFRRRDAVLCGCRGQNRVQHSLLLVRPSPFFLEPRAGRSYGPGRWGFSRGMPVAGDRPERAAALQRGLIGHACSQQEVQAGPGLKGRQVPRTPTGSGLRPPRASWSLGPPAHGPLPASRSQELGGRVSGPAPCSPSRVLASTEGGPAGGAPSARLRLPPPHGRGPSHCQEAVDNAMEPWGIPEACSPCPGNFVTLSPRGPGTPCRGGLRGREPQGRGGQPAALGGRGPGEVWAGSQPWGTWGFTWEPGPGSNGYLFSRPKRSGWPCR